MRTLRGTTPVESGCLDPNLNIFYTKTSDGRLYVMRQPRKKDKGAVKKALRKISNENWMRYARVNIQDRWLYDVNQRCKAPLYRGEFPGILPLTVVVDGEIVGFSDGFFRLGVDFERYKVEPTDKCGNFSIVALDKLHGHGIGSYYAPTSNAIARHFGCKWILGTTYMRGGMRGIRRREGWEIVEQYTNGTVAHRKLL